MKVVKLLIGAAVVTGMIAGNVQSASATANVCKIEPVTKITSLTDTGKNFTFNDNGTVTGHFKVTGDSSCKVYAVLAVWEAPNGTNGEPLSAQKLYSYDNNGKKPFGPGVHKLTAKMPNCYYQLDLLEGTDPKGKDGTANYGTLLNPERHMLDTKHGGTKKCGEEPKKPEQPKTPETPVTPAPAVAAVQTETGKLPSTGPADVAATFAGVSTSAGVAHAIVRRFRRNK